MHTLSESSAAGIVLSTGFVFGEDFSCRATRSVRNGDETSVWYGLTRVQCAHRVPLSWKGFNITQNFCHFKHLSPPCFALEFFFCVWICFTLADKGQNVGDGNVSVFSFHFSEKIRAQTQTSEFIWDMFVLPRTERERRGRAAAQEDRETGGQRENKTEGQRDGKTGNVGQRDWRTEIETGEKNTGGRCLQEGTFSPEHWVLSEMTVPEDRPMCGGNRDEYVFHSKKWNRKESSRRWM